MKRILFIYFLLIFLSSSFSYAKELYEFSHFAYVVPDEWHMRASEKSNYHYGKAFGDVDGGFIMAQMQITDYKSEEIKLSSYYNSVINAFYRIDKGNSSKVYIQDININGHQGVISLGTIKVNDNVYDVAAVFLFVGNHIFCEAYADPQKTPEQLFDAVKELSRYIVFLGDE